MSTVFTENEIKIFKAWLSNKKNKEIAEELGISEPYVSQTIKKIQEKIGTLEKSLEVLNQMGLASAREEFKLTEKGRESYKKTKEKLKGKVKSDPSAIARVIQESILAIPNEDDKNKSRINELIYANSMRKRQVDALLGVTVIDAKNIPYKWGSTKDDAFMSYTSIINATLGSTTKPLSELEFETTLLNQITQRMTNLILASEITENSSSIVSNLNHTVKQLYQLIEWLNSKGQVQQNRAR